MMTDTTRIALARRAQRGVARVMASQRGSALLIVIVLLSLIGTLVVSNSVVLRRFKVELQLLEQKQQRALAQRATNSAAVDGSRGPAGDPSR